MQCSCCLLPSQYPRWCSFHAKVISIMAKDIKHMQGGSFPVPILRYYMSWLDSQRVCTHQKA